MCLVCTTMHCNKTGDRFTNVLLSARRSDMPSYNEKIVETPKTIIGCLRTATIMCGESRGSGRPSAIMSPFHPLGLTCNLSYKFYYIIGCCQNLLRGAPGRLERNYSVRFPKERPNLQRESHFHTLFLKTLPPHPQQDGKCYHHCLYCFDRHEDSTAFCRRPNHGTLRDGIGYVTKTP